jgi:hypothetical protein
MRPTPPAWTFRQAARHFAWAVAGTYLAVSVVLVPYWASLMHH